MTQRRPSRYSLVKLFLRFPLLPFIRTYQLIVKSIAEKKRDKLLLPRWPRPVPKPKCIKPLVNNKPSQSEFFMLPTEIRLIIYNYIFSFSDIHLLTFYYSGDLDRQLQPQYYLDSYSCLNTSMAVHSYMCPCLSGKCWIPDVSQGRTTNNRRGTADWPDSGLKRETQNLSIVCREFYFDIIDIRTRYCNFRIDDLHSTIIASLTQPYLFNSIRSLYLNTNSPYTDFTGGISHLPASYRKHFSHLTPDSGPFVGKRPVLWYATCDAISNMTSLKRLRVQLSRKAFSILLPARHQYRRLPKLVADGAFLYKPLLHISEKKNLETFEVEIDWEEEDDWKWIDRAREKGVVFVGRGR